MRKLIGLQDILLCVYLAIFPVSVSALVITDDASGGDCSSIGTWDASSKTCTLTQDIENNPITLDSDGITLDGGGHTLTSSSSTFSDGIFSLHQSNITVKNTRFTGYGGINFRDIATSTIENNIFQNMQLGVSGDENMTNALVRKNLFENIEASVQFQRSGPVRIEENTFRVQGNHAGIRLIENNAAFSTVIAQNLMEGDGQSTGIWTDRDTRGVTIENNTIRNHDTGILFYPCSNDHVVKNNAIGGNRRALSFEDGSTGSVVSQNNFRNNTLSVDSHHFTFNCGGNSAFLSLPPPEGGNYWDVYDEQHEGCADTNADGFCDNAYIVTTTFPETFTDYFPRTVPVLDPPIPPIPPSPRPESFAFPLPNLTPYTAEIRSVMDHSNAERFGCHDGVIVTYTGELGLQDNGRDGGVSTYYPKTPRIPNDFECRDQSRLFDYKNSRGTSFEVTGNYRTSLRPRLREFISYDGHPGYDYPVPGGTNVLAAADGKVTLSCPNKLGEIDVDHGDGLFTMYNHLSKCSVGVGDTVTKGQVIGKSGKKGASYPHLHFSVFKGYPAPYKYVDPYGWDPIGGADVLVDPHPETSGCLWELCQ